MTKVVKLSDVIDTIKGYAFKSSWFTSSGTPIVKVKDFTDDSISRDALDYIQEQVASEFSRYSLEEDDIIIQTVGSWEHNPNSVVGKVVRVPKNLDGALLNQNAVKLICNKNVDKRFLFYRLKDSSFKGYIIKTAQGAANQASITLDSIRAFQFPLPPLNVQRRIADVLIAYDDLIENNLRRIQLLEKAALCRYKQMMEGSEVQTLTIKDICQVGRGSSPRPIADQRYFVGGSIPWIKIADATSSFRYIHKAKQHVNEFGASFSRKLPAGSLIVAASGTLGFPMFLAVEACIHDGWLYFIDLPDQLKHLFYFRMKELTGFFNQQSYGAAIQNINTDILREAPVLLPKSKTLLNEFNMAAQGYDNLMFNLQKQVELLKEARDTLLPRLMSGEIDVTSFAAPQTEIEVLEIV